LNAIERDKNEEERHVQSGRNRCATQKKQAKTSHKKSSVSSAKERNNNRLTLTNWNSSKTELSKSDVELERKRES
jgi:hypothetical protein